MEEKAIIGEKGNYTLSKSVYTGYSQQEPKDNNLDVFSILGVLSENADIFLELDENKRHKSMLRYMYSQSEISNLLKKNKVRNLDGLLNLIKKSQGDEKVPEHLKQVSNDLQKMEEYVSAVTRDVNLSHVLTTPGREHPDRLRLIRSGALSLVENLLLLNHGSDLKKITVRARGIEPLILDETKISKSKMQLIYENTEKHVKKVYGKKIRKTIKDQPEGDAGRFLYCHLNKDPLTNSVNLLYRVAKTLPGSKNISFDKAKQYVTFREGVEELEEPFNNRTKELSEAVTMLTTIFMCRFVLDSSTYYEVNKQLSVQLAYKLRKLVFSDDGEFGNEASIEDAWLIKYLQDRVMRNVTEIVTKNGIRSAQALANIYNKNGTMITMPKDIVNIKDLVFAQQFNYSSQQKEQKLQNSIENKVEPIIKNKDFSIIISRIKDPAIKKLLSDPKYLKLYEDTYRQAYENFLSPKENLDEKEIVEKVITQAHNDAQRDALLDTKNKVLEKDDDVNSFAASQYNNSNTPEYSYKEIIEEDDKIVNNEVGVEENFQDVPEEKQEVEEEEVAEVQLEQPIENAVPVDAQEVVEEKVVEIQPEQPIEKEQTQEITKPKIATTTFHTEPKPETPEELYESIKKSYASLLKSKNLQSLLNLRSLNTERIQTNKQNLAGKQVKDYMIDEIATTLAERTFVYYCKAKKSTNVNISDRPRAIISCYCNEILMGKSIFSANWRKSVDPLLAVILANECNSALKEINLEYAVDEGTYATVNKKYSSQIANFVKDLAKYREKNQKTSTESSSEENS